MAEDGTESGLRGTDIGRAIRESVASVVRQPLAGRIVEESLASAAIGTVPVAIADLRSFVREHLLPACSRRAGPAASAALDERLAPMLDAIARLPRATRRRA